MGKKAAFCLSCFCVKEIWCIVLLSRKMNSVKTWRPFAVLLRVVSSHPLWLNMHARCNSKLCFLFSIHHLIVHYSRSRVVHYAPLHPWILQNIPVLDGIELKVFPLYCELDMPRGYWLCIRLSAYKLIIPEWLYRSFLLTGDSEDCLLLCIYSLFRSTHNHGSVSTFIISEILL